MKCSGGRTKARTFAKYELGRRGRWRAASIDYSLPSAERLEAEAKLAEAEGDFDAPGSPPRMTSFRLRRLLREMESANAAMATAAVVELLRAAEAELAELLGTTEAEPR